MTPRERRLRRALAALLRAVRAVESCAHECVPVSASVASCHRRAWIEAVAEAHATMRATCEETVN